MSIRRTNIPIANRPPNVLHVRVMAGTGGGPEKTILHSPGYADPARCQMHVAYITPVGNPANAELCQRAAELDCPLHLIEERGPVDWRTVRRLARLCDELDIDIWHGHDYKSNLIGLLLRRRRPMKLISTVHLWTDETWRLKLYRHVDQRVLPRYDRVITVSEALAERCRVIGVAAHRVRYVPNAIEPHKFVRTQSPAEARSRLGLDPDRLTIGFVGRLSIQKRIDRLLDVLPQLRRHRQGLQVLIIGDGAQRQALQQRTTALGLDDTVRFCGWRMPVHPWYEAMDLMVLPSEREGLPNVLLEAMALEVPVAATDVGANRDLLDGGRCGVLLSDDVGGWLDPLQRFMNDAALGRQYADEARHRIETRFSFAARMEQMMREYERLCGDAGDAAFEAQPMAA